MDLVVIYKFLEEFDEALEQNGSILSFMKKEKKKNSATYSVELLLKAEIETGDLLVDLGRYKEAKSVLKGVVSDAPKDGVLHGLALVSLGRAYFYMDKYATTKRFLERARKILEKKDKSDPRVGAAFGTMIDIYQGMSYSRTAFSLLKDVLEIPSLPKEFVCNSYTRLLALVYSGKKEKKYSKYLDDLVAASKDKFGFSFDEKTGITGSSQLLKLEDDYHFGYKGEPNFATLFLVVPAPSFTALSINDGDSFTTFYCIRRGSYVIMCCDTKLTNPKTGRVNRYSGLKIRRLFNSGFYIAFSGTGKVFERVYDSLSKLYPEDTKVDNIKDITDCIEGNLEDGDDV